MGRNICKCPSPPGGTVECPEGFMPFCVVKKDQEPKNICLEPFEDATNEQIVNRILSIVTGTRKFIESPISDHELTMLQKGKFESRDTIVTFSMSDQVENAVNEVIIDRGGTNFDLGKEPENY